MVMMLDAPISAEDVKMVSADDYLALLSSGDEEKCHHALIRLKNEVIGSNRAKSKVIQAGLVPKLIKILVDPVSPVDLQTETIIVLGSLAKGADANVRVLLDSNVIPVLITKLNSPIPRIVEATLSCLRTIMKHPMAPTDHIFHEHGLVTHLINLLPRSISIQENVTSILATACRTTEHQNVLASHGLIKSLVALLCSPHNRVQMSSLNCLVLLAYKNQKVSGMIANASFGGKACPDLLSDLVNRDKLCSIQLAAAKCLAYLCWCGVLPSDDRRVVFKALPTLVRMCKSTHNPQSRMRAAETLAHLIENSSALQKIAAMSDHLITTLGEFLKYQLPGIRLMGESFLSHHPGGVSGSEEDTHVALALRKAAFLAFASLGANDEEIRKKIIDTPSLMDTISQTVEDPKQNEEDVLLAACRCLHSMSRSVQQLRTTFKDYAVWKPLLKILMGPMVPTDLAIVASSTLCNLLLEFSPSKEPLLESGATEVFSALTRHDDPGLRLNGIWGLMNLVFGSEQRTKTVASLSATPHLRYQTAIREVQTSAEPMLTSKMQEDGDSAKDFIMGNEDVLGKLATYLGHTQTRLPIAATVCVTNLLSSASEEKLHERQDRLREIGIDKIMHQIVNQGTNADALLFDKAKDALQQFVA
ncbi:unnamed protein product [Cyprideis torosa]|uniref:Armadillo repeat-containing protein 8 n=1 Tax=Cyprideis torosa TaxID=163714 RepID=A0A7R8WJJ2_9CRUS|nr:unnamed protein product [Cyprideis torosa]CAG0896044.1 unnamed protein product [Cyprideis torosa]